MNTARVVAFLIAVGMSVGFGYSLGEAAGRKAAVSDDGVSTYQYERMARQFSRTVYEQYASAPDAKTSAEAASTTPARPSRPLPSANALEQAGAPRTMPVGDRRGDGEE